MIKVFDKSHCHNLLPKNIHWSDFQNCRLRSSSMCAWYCESCAPERFCLDGCSANTMEYIKTTFCCNRYNSHNWYILIVHYPQSTAFMRLFFLRPKSWLSKKKSYYVEDSVEEMRSSVTIDVAFFFLLESW